MHENFVEGIYYWLSGSKSPMTQQYQDGNFVFCRYVHKHDKNFTIKSHSSCFVLFCFVLNPIIESFYTCISLIPSSNVSFKYNIIKQTEVYFKKFNGDCMNVMHLYCIKMILI